MLALTDGQGVDVAIEAVGIPATFTCAPTSSGPAAMSPTSACTASPWSCPCEDLWIQNINISMGLVNTNTTPHAAQTRGAEKDPRGQFATHHFAFDQFMEAYDTFARAAETKALKVVITA